MGKKFAVAFALVALMAAPAFASVQNVKVGGSLDTVSVIRNGFDLGNVNATARENNRTQNVVMGRVMLNVEADLTDNVSTKIGLLNERLWGTAESSVNSSMLVDTAYVTMKELLYSPLTVTVGRQPLTYGNKLIIGDGDGSGLAAVSDLTGGVNFDAIKAVLSYDPLTVDLFAAKSIEGKSTTASGSSGTNVFGVNANYKLGDKMSTVVEAYTFAKEVTLDSGVLNNKRGDVLYVPGLRVSTNPIEGLNAQLEGAYQFGTLANDAAGTQGKKNVSAYVLQGGVNYALPMVKNMKPVVAAGLTYYSGEKLPATGAAADNKIRAYQDMFADQDVGTIWSTLFSKSNLVIAKLSGEITPVQDLTAKLTWSNLSMAQRSSSIILNRPDGTVAEAAIATSGKKQLGNELDLDLSYAYTEDVKFGVCAGYYAPGKGLSPAAQDSASQLLSSVSVSF
ncbi:MAG: alginate export family protein [Candidatus Omnitrophota bacterium]